MTVYDPSSLPAPLARIARLGRRLSLAPLLFAATLALAVPACGDDPKPDDNSNNAANNPNNNPNNNPTNNVNNNPTNNVNNNPTNNVNNNNPTNNVNNNPDPIAACMEACTTLGTTCRDEFLEECPAQVVDGLIPACQEGCNDPDARAQIEAVAGLPCATVVPLAISGFGLTDLCADPDLCADANCEAGTTCDPADGMCKPDDLCANVNCEAGTTCDPADGVCKADDLCEGVVCEAESACDPADGMCKPIDLDLCEGVTCEEGLVCNPADGTCGEPPACGDANEPNNTSAEATPITAEDQTIEGLSICLADRDFYSFTLPAGQSAQLSFLFSDDVADIDVIATVTVNGVATTLSAGSSSDNEYIGIAPRAADATVVVEAYVFQNAGENDYSMVIDIDPTGGACNTNADCTVEDTFCGAEKLCQELGPCDTDADCPAALTCDTATNTCVDCLSDDDCGFFETCDLATNTCLECASDLDCFGDEICSPEGTCVECSTNDQCESGLCDPDGSCAECTSDLNCTGGEVCDITDNSCVQCVTADQCAEGFTCLEATNTCAPAACDGTPDNNDTFETATTIQAGTFDSVACGGEQDWYAITVAEGDDLYVTISFSDVLGDIDASLIGSNGTTSVDTSGSTRDNEYLVGLNLTAGIYYIQVRGFSGASNTYTVDAQINPALTLCNTANPCAAGTTCTERQVCVDMGTCEADRDCPSTGNTLCDLLSNTCVQCTSNDQCASDLCNPSGLCAECTTDDECFGGEVCNGENLCVECTSDDQCTGGEVCNVDAGSCVACNVDADCPNNFACTQNVCLPTNCDGQADGNDTRETAESITQGDYDFVICDGENDWYSITVAEGDDLYISFSFLDSIGDIDTTLYRGEETTSLDTSAGSRDGENLVGLNLTAGTYVWQVRGFLGATNAYTMSVQINPELPLCDVDGDCSNGQECTDRKLCFDPNVCEEVRDCGFDQECSAGRCVECSVDDDCSGDEVCNLDGLCVECVVNDQCDSGLCNIDNTCAECVTDEQCTGGDICNPVNNLCVECFSDDNCTNNDICDLDTNFCVCGPDAAGENDSFDNAFALTPPTSLAALSTCDGDSYFSVNLTAGQTLTATINFVDNDGDLDLFVYDSNEIEVDSSEGTSDTETATYTAATSGTHYIAVIGFFGASNDFDIEISVQ